MGAAVGPWYGEARGSWSCRGLTHKLPLPELFGSPGLSGRVPACGAHGPGRWADGEDCFEAEPSTREGRKEEGGARFPRTARVTRR